MTFLDHIDRRSPLLATIAISAVVAAGAVLWCAISGVMPVSARTAPLLLAPWPVFAFSVLPLVYLSWFKNSRTGVATTIFKALYWVLAAVTVAVFAGAYLVAVGVWR